MKVEKRYEVISQSEKSKWVVWFNDIVKKWPITVAEAQQAAKKEFPGVNHSLLVMWKDACGIAMKIDTNSKKMSKRYKSALSNSERQCYAWYNEKLTEYLLTLAEIEKAAKKEYPNVQRRRLILQQYECGIILRVV
ncbi:MAG: hypothetical protein U9P90_02040, partial [Patescibacteria group bacterium]|nr:hypothetical protein [Patescibacteria group bacterium]